MYKEKLTLFILMLFSASLVFAQEPENTNDTFFLAKRKGLLGKLGRTIAISSSSVKPVKVADPFKKYNGKIIRYVEIVPVGFNQNLNDTTELPRNLAIRIADKLHKDTRTDVIRKNLFFKEGDVFLPLLISDNERFLREQPYLQDAMIVAYKSVMSSDSVDIIVLTRDIFSIGGSVKANGFNRIGVEVKEENIAGTGSYLSVSNLYDKNRKPEFGIGAEFTARNIKGLFLNWTTGFKTFKNAIVNNRYEEGSYYTRIEKPLVSRYTQWTGAVAFSYNRTRNNYIDQPSYLVNAQYSYTNVDLWGGYNIGYSSNKKTDSENRLRHFIAARSFYTHFDKLPSLYKDSFNFNYANLNGILFSYSLYKQNFYKTNFIYGFGRNEDVAIGINATLTAGWTNKQNVMRGYYGFDFEGSHYSQRGFFSSYKLRAGGYKGISAFEDISMLLGVDHFTRLRQLNRKWLNRNFISLYYTKLFNANLNEPLFLQSEFGLPYFRTDSVNTIEARSRATVKLESVFFNLRKFFGFRFAPFAFTEFSFLAPINNMGKKTTTFSAIGGGVRTRNENLIFGTIEVRGFYFPRVTKGLEPWKVELSLNLKFRYNSSFIKKPDFVKTN